MNSGKGKYHLIALSVAVIWGTTFISTKVLLADGLDPKDILFYRFLSAYIGIWFFGSRKLFAKSVKDELLLVVCGLCGGSLYFLAENTALKITLASNVALIVCTAPVLTAILSHFILKNERLTKNRMLGSFIALAGVALVVFNGSFILKINPLGDLLTFSAALVWGIYTMVLKHLDNRYSTFFITRKVFFYGLLTILPVFLVTPLTVDPQILFKPEVLGNLLYLGFAASLACYVLWNLCLKYLGAVKTTNYVYTIPVITFIASALILGERITFIAFVGAVLIISGVYLADRKGRV
ncbi:MAG: DMT family transporter [Candidatus Azobacteroides sp.]|nr:DMT family transporter [Candidatus Azobacteroides sp.]